MTIPNGHSHFFQDETHSNDTNYHHHHHHDKPFKIVLVDLEKAANDKVICCVEKPLHDNDLKYVALSYRWGELSETIIDTELGYLATITSFDLGDFYLLCRMIREERDLHTMDYVWVDAICVDQTNHDRRKATIHHMSTIYAQATYVLAVPDLHLQHVAMATAMNWEIIENSHRYSEYLCHLLHGNTKLLAQLDNAWLNRIQYDPNWQAQILQRSKHIQISMDFLSDLVRDWSARVWVISEFHIAAKHQKKLKYWFIQLELPPLALVDTTASQKACYYVFFEFNFDDPYAKLTSLLDDTFITASNPVLHQAILASDAVYQQFHTLMIRQLDQQTFLEMMLASKARKNEDRFYSILPLSEYKHQLCSQDVVDSWQIHNAFSVKLKLFEWMTAIDKLTLLYLSGGRHSVKRTKVLPTFATTTIYWPENLDEYPQFVTLQEGGNFDIHAFDTITLTPYPTDTHVYPYKLTLKPVAYYVIKSEMIHYLSQTGLKQNKTIWKHLSHIEEEEEKEKKLDVVCIPTHFMTFDTGDFSEDETVHYLFLVGNFDNNKWILEEHFGAESLGNHTDHTHHYCQKEYPCGFDIY